MSIFQGLRPTSSIVVLTGAGISAESGLATFRGTDGLWEGHKVEEVATAQAFAENPALVHQFYNMRRRGLLDPSVAPNAAHQALARLEGAWPGKFLLVTQNIDDLHERAGSKNLIHMHGEALKVFCATCSGGTGKKIPWRSDLGMKDTCPDCGATGSLRPDIVWFGEMPYRMDDIYAALESCDAFISIGTSGNVYPAAGFVVAARQNAAVTLEVNLSASVHASAFSDGVYGAASDRVPEIVQSLLSIAARTG